MLTIPSFRSYKHGVFILATTPSYTPLASAVTLISVFLLLELLRKHTRSGAMSSICCAPCFERELLMSARLRVTMHEVCFAPVINANHSGIILSLYSLDAV